MGGTRVTAKKKSTPKIEDVRDPEAQTWNPLVVFQGGATPAAEATLPKPPAPEWFFSKRCPRCGTLDTVRIGGAEPGVTTPMQRRKCRAPICGHKFKRFGQLVRVQ